MWQALPFAREGQVSGIQQAGATSQVAAHFISGVLMQAARVIGNATATIKHSSMEGWRLLVVQPLLADGHTPDGDPILAVDALGAGLGSTVIISSDGKGTRELLKRDDTPVRWSVIGIAD